MEKIPLIKLIGDPLENFYQLGIKDKENCQIIDEIKNPIRTPWPLFNKYFGRGVEFVLKQTSGYNKLFTKEFNAYCEGLSRKPEEVAISLLLPEIFSSFSKWTPNISQLLMGCSSIFIWDQKKDSLIHGRVLDYTINSFDKNERAIIYKFYDKPIIFSHTTSGFPFPSITSMTSSGVTLALHQKFTNKFDYRGSSIFAIIHNLLNQCHDFSSAIECLKNSHSFTSWGINMGFKNGDVLEADLMGNNLYYRKHNIREKQYVYLCNISIDDETKSENLLFHSLEEFNNMKLKTFNKKKDSINNDGLNLLKAIATPSISKGSNLKDWNMDMANHTSINTSTLCPEEGYSLFIPGKAPKYFSGEYIQFSNIWDNPTQELKKTIAEKIDPNYHLGMKELINAQIEEYNRDMHKVYHNLQMSIKHLQSYGEKLIPLFYFLVYQYINENYPSIHERLLKEFLTLNGNLTLNLNDHCLLFISRLQRLLNKEHTVEEEHIKNNVLKKIYCIEQNIKPKIIHMLSKVLFKPRIDLLDITYYYKVNP